MGPEFSTKLCPFKDNTGVTCGHPINTSEDVVHLRSHIGDLTVEEGGEDEKENEGETGKGKRGRGKGGKGKKNGGDGGDKVLLKCPEPNCGCTQRPSIFYRHFRTHYMRFKCPLDGCSYEHGRKDTMKRHITKKHGIKLPSENDYKHCKNCSCTGFSEEILMGST